MTKTKKQLSITPEDADGQEPLESFRKPLTLVEQNVDSDGNPFLPETAPITIQEMDELLKLQKADHIAKVALQNAIAKRKEEILEMVERYPENFTKDSQGNIEYHGDHVSATFSKTPEKITLRINIEDEDDD